MEINNTPDRRLGQIVYTLLLIAFAIFGLGGI